MKYLIKIILLSFILSCVAFARVSGKHSGPDHFAKNKTGAPKKEYVPGNSNGDEDSIKWKRRHKRRKKAKNRRPQRGR